MSSPSQPHGMKTCSTSRLNSDVLSRCLETCLTPRSNNNIIPTIFNGLPVVKRWADIGAHGRMVKITNVVQHDNYRLCLVPGGYVLLCSKNSCKGLQSENNLCKNHNKGKESYSFCREEGCTTSACFGYEDNKSLRCSKHKIYGMIDVKNKRCKYPGCKTGRTFGDVGKAREFCSKHKQNGMVNIVTRKCLVEGCDTVPIFGFEDGEAGYCFEHKEIGMVDVKNKTCKVPGCKTRRNYAQEGDPAEYCAEHKLKGMVDVVSKRCLHPECDTRPNFGYRNKKVKYCSKHKLPGMIDLKHKRCIHPECDTQPVFGYEQDSAKYCVTHRLAGMVDVKGKTCLHPDCKTKPVFGSEGERADYCAKHKLNGMVNVKDKRCSNSDCKTIPVFGYEWQKPKYCVKHKSALMINVVDKRCEHQNCEIRPNFGYEGGSASYCKSHKLTLMVDVKNKRCEHENCDTKPTYRKLYTKKRTHCREHSTLNEYNDFKSNPMCKHTDFTDSAYFYDFDDPNIYPVRCSEHKSISDIELVFKICENCKDELHFPSNQEFCMDCGRYREKTLYHFKELEIKYLLQSNNIKFIHDRKIHADGSKHRPDFLISCQFGYIIIEVDENQHRNYPLDEENKRMRIIYNNVQLIKPQAEVFFIRYNPDRYEGVQLPDKKAQHKYLYNIITTINSYSKINTPLCQVKLFYDGFDLKSQIEILKTHN